MKLGIAKDPLHEEVDNFIGKGVLLGKAFTWTDNPSLSDMEKPSLKRTCVVVEPNEYTRRVMNWNSLLVIIGYFYNNI